MFIPKDNVQYGFNLTWVAKKASQVISYGAALVNDTNAKATPATNTSTGFYGISLCKVAATDADYASNTLIPILSLMNGGRDTTFIADAAGTAVIADEGKVCDLTDSLTVNRAATSVKVFQITKFLSTTKVEGKFINPALTA